MIVSLNYARYAGMQFCLESEKTRAAANRFRPARNGNPKVRKYKYFLG